MSMRLHDDCDTSPLGEVCQLNPPRKEIASLPDDLDVSFVPMAAVSADGRLVEVQTRKVGEVKKGFPHFRERDVLVAKITPCFENGKRWLAGSLVNGIGFGSTEFHVLRASGKVLPEWIYYFVSLPEFRRDGQLRMTGTAGQKRVPSSFLEEYRIPVPPLAVQEKTVGVLRRAEQLKEIREQANQLTNKIIQSAYFERFGDPSSTVRWPRKTLADLCSMIRDGPHKRPEYQSSGVPFLTVHNISEMGFLLDEVFYISPEQHEELKRRVLPQRGDVLYTKGGTTGIAREVDVDFEFSVYVHVAVLRPKRDLMNPTFLEISLNSRYCKEQAARLTRGIANRDLVLSQMRQVVVPTPPLELQEEFTKFVKRIRALQECQRQSAHEINELFHSLMHKAFRSDLNGHS
jgi:type I restriction enzyme S subunit